MNIREKYDENDEKTADLAKIRAELLKTYIIVHATAVRYTSSLLIRCEITP
jgi:hypothetical protein